MQVDLIDLLKDREFQHPSRITKIVSLCDASLRLDVTGFRWWAAGVQEAPLGSVTYHFEGITDGHLDSQELAADPFEEDLEPFNVCALADFDWAKGVDCQIYCQGPIRNPLDLYATLYDFLLSAGCPFGASHFLNFGERRSIAVYQKIVSSNSYLLCSGPEAICNVVTEELRAQGTGFNVVRGADWGRGLVWVAFGASWLICNSAYAVFEP